jgi:hypothetical protein
LRRIGENEDERGPDDVQRQPNQQQRPGRHGVFPSLILDPTAPVLTDA